MFYFRLGETCSHVAAVLYKIEAAVRIGLTSAAPTDLPCKWNQNFTKNIVGCPVAEISIYSDSAKSKVNKSKTSVQEKRASDDEILGFLNSIAEVAPNTVCLSLFSQFQKNFTSVSQPDPNALTMKLPDSLRSLYHCNNLLLASTEFDELVEASIEKVQELSEQQMLYVEEATRNQSRCFAWFQQRAGRITGSTFYEAAHTSTTNPSKSLVQKLCSENSIQLNVPSLSWGRDHESEVITLYQSAFSNANFSNSCIPLHNSTLHENLSVEQIGLCISKDKPWYAASPDAVVFCDCCSYGVLEVKCPYSLRDMSLKEEIHKNKFYIKVNDEGEYILNEKHKYYYQVQLEMFATDTEHCDFMVWTPKEFICVRVPINRTFLENTMKICDGFWRNIVLKELLLRTFESDKARLTSTSKVVNKLCKCGNDEGEMVGCDSCDNWYHPTCIGRKTLPTSKTWYCKDCKKRKAK